MLAGADPAVLAAPAGHPAVLDADGGELLVGAVPTDRGPADRGPADPARARALPRRPRPGTVLSEAGRTADGEPVTILGNVASAAETRLGLANGAAGVGLLRTEIPFIRATGWPAAPTTWPR